MTLPLSQSYQIGPFGLLFETDNLTIAAETRIHFGSFAVRSVSRPSVRLRLCLRRPSRSPSRRWVRGKDLEIRLQAGPSGPTYTAWPRRPMDPRSCHYGFLEPLVHQVLREAGLYPTHAACLVRGRGALVLCGGNNAGKTSTALTLDGRGFRLLSDEDSFIWREGAQARVAAGGEGVSLTQEGAQRLWTPGHIRRLEWVTRGGLWKFWQPFRPGRRGDAPLRAMAFLKRPRVPDRRTRVRPLTRAEAVFTLLSGSTERSLPISDLKSRLPVNQAWLAGLFSVVRPYEVMLGSDPAGIVRAFHKMDGF